MGHRNYENRTLTFFLRHPVHDVIYDMINDMIYDMIYDMIPGVPQKGLPL